MSNNPKSYGEIDFYDLIGVTIEATQNEIRKAYRKKALECHPDKNPDNPKAGELFHELSKALEILTDASAKSAYDKVLQAKKAAEIRTLQLDSKRQKLKQELEAREKAGVSKLNQPNFSNVRRTLEEELLVEIQRLRKEGSKLLEEEQRLLQEQLKEERIKRENHFDSSKYRIKIKWICAKDDLNNGGYSKESLERIFNKYGDIEVLVLSNKKGSALLEFKSYKAAEMALSYEKGLQNNPLSLGWLSDGPKTAKNSSKVNSTVISDKDYESLVLRQMRQAEERRKLIEQMMKEEDAD